MKIHIDDIKATPRSLAYAEDVTELNARLAGRVRDYGFSRELAVEIEYYRAGLDVFLRGTVGGDVTGTCARCLEEYPFHIDHPFTVVLTPQRAAAEGAELAEEDMALSSYEGEEIDVTPLVYEQTILALPTRPLCREDCRGLCARCGANLNIARCDCPEAPLDGRLAVLHALARGK